MRFLTAVIAILALSGCASSTYFAQHSPNSKEATVYVIRERAEPRAWNMNIYVDKVKAASLSNHSFVKFSVPAGQHAFGFDWPILAGSPTVRAKIAFKGGEARYFVVTGESRVIGFYVVALLEEQSTRVVEVRKNEADQIVQRLHK